LQKELAKLIQLERVDSLWHADDASWQDKAKRTKKTDELAILARGHTAACEVLLQALDRAIEDAPPDLPATNSGEGLAASVRDALALDGLGMGRSPWEILPTLQELVDARLNLMRTVQSHADQLDSKKAGLRFTDAEIEESIRREHAKIRDQLRLRRESLVEYAENTLLESASRMHEIDRRGNPLEFQYLTDRVKYLRGELEDVPKRIRKRIQAVEKLDEKVATDKAKRLADLEAEWKSFKERVDALVTRSKEIAEDPARP
jgi:hypothetical protein